MALRDYLAEEVALDFGDALLTRRDALRRLGLLGLSTGSAVALLAACGGGGNGGSDDAGDGGAAPTSTPPATAPTVAEDITFPGPQGELIGAWAAAPDPKGAVLVIHENRGLTDHIRSIPPRFAADGYSALAVDLLSEEGGTAAVGGEAEATAALGQAPPERLVADLRAGLDELERREPDAGLAAVGFCFGGGMTWQLLAAGEPRLAAAVPFYGPAPADADFSGSDAAVLAIYGELDARVNATRDPAVAALEAAGLTYEVSTFPGADHAFFNDTGPRYNEAAATEAYAAVLAWFDTHLA
ncbi:MAG: dienelactone hydrolase family protein [Acidimicrobiia bacterium]